ncbi:nuclear transport factor 2 family protein [Marinifilum flexuosum]|uniref:nuclear transport factor 2 family protein n=1 Tax=Marinifilum flexuosum TaxID=1117708 RepID=UPI0024901AC4|nr:nuclear transport factor 2 family protein [Marinifilum flexuosum]
MKNYFYIISVLLLLSACVSVDKQENDKEPEKAIIGFYDAMKVFNYESARTFCTEDFYAIENAKTFNNLDEFIELVKTFEGAKIDIDIQVEKADVKQKTAVLVVKFDAIVAMNEKKMNMQSIETYHMVKQKQKWLIGSFHSTYVKKEDPVHYKSMHLLKVSDKLSVSVLDEPIKQINEAIGEIGFPECGYVIYSTTNEHEIDYTHVFEGKWLSKANYDLIHEHEKYKEVTEKHKSKFKDLFTGQVYFKVEN